MFLNILLISDNISNDIKINNKINYVNIFENKRKLKKKRELNK